MTQTSWQGRECLEPDSSWVRVLPQILAHPAAWGQGLPLRLLGRKGDSTGSTDRAAWGIRMPRRAVGCAGLSCHRRAPGWGRCHSRSGVKGSYPSPRESAVFLSQLLAAPSYPSTHASRALGFPGTCRRISHRSCPCLSPQLGGRDCCPSVSESPGAVCSYVVGGQYMNVERMTHPGLFPLISFSLGFWQS